MLLDAIVLAGGRSSRLSGVPKSQLLWHGATLLQNTVDAALRAGVGRVVVVGPDAPALDAQGPSVQASDARGQDAQASDARGSDARVRFTREDPPFAGPAAAVAAGLRALEQEGAAAAADAVLLLACDMPRIAEALAVLVESVPLGDSDGALLLDDSGRRQPLAAVYARRALVDAVAGLRASGTLDGASMRSLISGLDLLELPDTAGSTRDVDTWGDADAFGIEQPHQASPDEQTSPDKQRSRP